VPVSFCMALDFRFKFCRFLMA
jgi:hypothetical protein